MYLGDSLPELMIQILSATGYAISISELDSTEIGIIEEFVTKNLKHLLKDSKSYSQTDPFVFLPGHKKLLISLPIKAIAFKNSNSKSRTRAKTETVYGAGSVESQETIELLTNEGNEILKKSLILKLNNYIRTAGLTTEFKEDALVSPIDTYISHSRTSDKNSSYKCSIKCIFCTKIVPCTHHGYWQTSNLEKHVKSHIESNAKSSVGTKITLNDKKDGESTTVNQNLEKEEEEDKIQNEKSNKKSGSDSIFIPIEHDSELNIVLGLEKNLKL